MKQLTMLFVSLTLIFSFRPVVQAAKPCSDVPFEVVAEEFKFPEGPAFDSEGNLYVVAAGGVWVFSSDGEHLGSIPVPDPRPTNCAWGGNDWRTLFIAARTSVYRVRLQIPGIPVP